MKIVEPLLNIKVYHNKTKINIMVLSSDIQTEDCLNAEIYQSDCILLYLKICKEKQLNYIFVISC